MANINRVDVIKILGVTVANTLSVHEHVSNVISSLWTLWTFWANKNWLKKLIDWYHLRPKPNNFKLTTKNRSITKCDFITRMLLKSFIDSMLVTLLFYAFASFFTCIVFYFPLFITFQQVVTLGCGLSTIVEVIFDLIWLTMARNRQQNVKVIQQETASNGPGRYLWMRCSLPAFSFLFHQ